MRHISSFSSILLNAFNFAAGLFNLNIENLHLIYLHRWNIIKLRREKTTLVMDLTSGNIKVKVKLRNNSVFVFKSGLQLSLASE